MRALVMGKVYPAEKTDQPRNHNALPLVVKFGGRWRRVYKGGFILHQNHRTPVIFIKER
jgi:hypothetical protein